MPPCSPDGATLGSIRRRAMSLAAALLLLACLPGWARAVDPPAAAPMPAWLDSSEFNAAPASPAALLQDVLNTLGEGSSPGPSAPSGKASAESAPSPPAPPPADGGESSSSPGDSASSPSPDANILDVSPSSALVPTILDLSPSPATEVPPPEPTLSTESNDTVAQDSLGSPSPQPSEPPGAPAPAEQPSPESPAEPAPPPAKAPAQNVPPSPVADSPSPSPSPAAAKSPSSSPARSPSPSPSPVSPSPASPSPLSPSPVASPPPVSPSPQPSPPPAFNSQQAAALISFKDSISSSNALDSWSSGSDNPCNGWAGVSCDSKGNVVSISLVDKGLSGTIPASLGDISTLVSLNLSSNSFSGSIPSDWSSNNALPALLSLNLADNKLSSMPSQLGGSGMKALQSAFLQGNSLAGSIPQWSTQAAVTLLPQNGIGPCGPLPGGGPQLLLTDGSSSWPLVNSLGSCLTSCNNQVVSLNGSNLFDAAVQNGATAWDTANFNPGSSNASSSSVRIPCYAGGSPVSSGGSPYLGGDMAFGMLAWGNGDNAGDVTASAPGSSSACSFTGSSWFVDLHVSLPLSQVVIEAGSSGISGITVSAGDNLLSLGRCASDVSVASSASVSVACASKGRYLSLTGGSMQLCSVQVYPAVANTAQGKPFYYSTGSGISSGNMWAGQQATLTARPNGSGQPALFVLDSGYQSAPIAGGVLINAAGVSSVRLASSNPLANSSGGRGSSARKLLRRLLQSDGPQCTVADGQFSCSGAQGRYLVLGNSSGGSLSLGGLSLYAAGTPGSTAEPVPLGGNTSAQAAAVPTGGWQSTWIQTLLVGPGLADTASIENATNQQAMIAAFNSAWGAALANVGYSLNTAATAIAGNLTANKSAAALASYGYPGNADQPNLLVNTTLQTYPGIDQATLYNTLNSDATRTNVQSGLAVFNYPDVWMVPYQPVDSSSGLSTGAIIGIAVGGALGALALAVLAYWLCSRRGGRGGRRPSTKGSEALEGAAVAGGATWNGLRPPPGQGQGQFLSASGGLGSHAQLKEAQALYNGSSSGQQAQLQHPSGSSNLDSQGTAKTASTSNDPLLAWIIKSQGTDSSGGGGTPNGTPGGSGSSRPGGRGSGKANKLAEMRDWNMNFCDLEIQKQIGEGSFGRVYLAKWNETLVAVKILLSANVDIDNVDAAERALSLSNPIMLSLEKEASMMASLRHPNTVQFIGVCLKPPCVATEYCARGSLTDVLRGARSGAAKAQQLDWSRRLNMALDAAKGMLYLHAHAPPIIHRDLKSANLLVDKHWRVKVSDFNLSKLMEADTVMSSMAATNPRWLAPEILAGHAATFASDVYAFAVVLWELLTWELPWGTTNPWQVVTLVTEGGRLEIPQRDALPGPDTASFEQLDKYCALIRRCWAQNPEARPTFQEVIADLRDMLSQTIARKGGAAAGGRPSTGGDSNGTTTPAETPHAASGEVPPGVPGPAGLDGSVIRRRMEGMGLQH